MPTYDKHHGYQILDEEDFHPPISGRASVWRPLRQRLEQLFRGEYPRDNIVMLFPENHDYGDDRTVEDVVNNAQTNSYGWASTFDLKGKGRRVSVSRWWLREKPEDWPDTEKWRGPYRGVTIEIVPIEARSKNGNG